MTSDLNGCCNEMGCERGAVETCDMFEFMSRHVGLTVLHPGGLRATSKLLGFLEIDKSSKVLDIACGKGLTSISIAKKYGCRVVGIDILEASIEEAQRNAREQGVEHLVSFQVMDAAEMAFPDNEFDVTLAQAVLILVKDSVGVVKEAARVLKPGGRAGWLELCWLEQPTEGFLQEAAQAMCGACIGNVGTAERWEQLFRNAGQRDITSKTCRMDPGGMIDMIRDEGLCNGLRIMGKYLTSAAIRKRMNRLADFFATYPRFAGYGVFTFRK